MIDIFTSKISERLKDQSGKVFYSGRTAFSEPSDLYVLGMNPGGDPNDPNETSVRQHTKLVLNGNPSWSAYSDESWKGRPAGTFGMQPRVLHLFDRIGRDPRRTPCSNLIFVRSRRIEGLAGNITELTGVCWPFHQEVIARLQPRVVICLGDDAGKLVRRRLNANMVVGEFVENNDRRWASRAYKNPSGLFVLSLTHPSIADWTNPSSDPSGLVKEVLNKSEPQI
jgi:hypothetical protein